MPARDVPGELRLPVEHGGRLVCMPAADAEQRARLCSMAWGLSMVFGGSCVRVQDYLPRLHLDIRALRPPAPLRSNAARHTVLDWYRVEHTLWNALHRPWSGEAIVVADEELHCVIRQASVPDAPEEPFAFTLQCRWPVVLDGGIDSAARRSV